MALKEKSKSGFNAAEFVFMFATLLIIISLFIPRFSASVNRGQLAQAKRNLSKICDLQKNYHQQNGRYGELSQIDFAYPGPNHSFEYYVSLADDKSFFLATAKEKDGYDPMKDNKPGNQVMTIDEKGYLGM